MISAVIVSADTQAKTVQLVGKILLPINLLKLSQLVLSTSLLAFCFALFVIEMFFFWFVCLVTLCFLYSLIIL